MAGVNRRVCKLRAFPKSPFVTLSEAKGLCAGDRILLFAQNDRRINSDFANGIVPF